jgi:hypothetical protein
MKFTAVSGVVAALCISCAGMNRDGSCPPPERGVVRVPVPGPDAQASCDCARSESGKEEISRVRRVSLRFAPAGEKDATDDAGRAAWRTHLEKDLLRRGFMVYDEPGRDPLSIEEETRPAANIDAWVIVERVNIRPVAMNIEVRFAEGPDGLASLEYAYHVAEIQGRFMLAHNDIVGSCGIALSSLELLRKEGADQPLLEVSGICEYRYSGKRGGWTRDRWRVDGDALSRGRAGAIGTQREALIRAASARFLEGLIR